MQALKRKIKIAGKEQIKIYAGGYMDKEFDIEIKEVLSRVETVKAESLDEAINKAMDMYYSER